MPPAPRTVLRALTLLALVPALVPRIASASGHFLHDQGGALDSDGLFLGGSVAAEDIELLERSRLDTITLWVVDGAVNDNGVLDNFNGTMGWALLTDDSGPDTFLYAGADNSPEIVDTGVQVSGSDSFRVRIDLDGRPVAPFGKFWIAVREGAWSSVYDGTPISLRYTQSGLGDAAERSEDEIDPQPESWTSLGNSIALTVEGDALHWNQGNFGTADFFGLTGHVVAADFTLEEETRLGSLDVWLRDFVQDDDGVLDSFGGTLSWAIYANAAGIPAASPLFTGHDSSPILTDTGVQNVNADVFRARIELAGTPTLAAGTYWLALHEGTWLSSGDGSSVYWVRTNSASADFDSVFSDAPTAPGNWQTLAGADYAFVLFEDELFASGFDAGVACAWSSTSGGALCP